MSTPSQQKIPNGNVVTVSLNKAKGTPAAAPVAATPTPQVTPVAASAAIPTEADVDGDDEDLSSLANLGDVDEDPGYGNPTVVTGVFSKDDDNQDLAESDFDSDSDDEIDSGVLEIFSTKCLKCSHLAPHAEKKFNSCHFSKGNTRCPAASVQILIGIPLDDIVNSFLAAEDTGDNARLGRLYAQLATKPDWQQQRINSALVAKRASRKSK